MKINQDNFIKELKNKNTAALHYLVDNYSNLIFKVIISVLGNEKREEAMECLNDVTLKIWQNINCYDENKSKFSSWVIAVSKYNAIDYRRKLVKEDNHCNIEDMELACDDRIEDELLSNENSMEIVNIINEMDKTDADIFISRYIIGESINEICERLCISRTAVDNRLYRGRKILKERLSSIEKEVI